MKLNGFLKSAFLAVGSAVFFAGCAGDYNPACDECDWRRVHSHVQGKYQEDQLIKTYTETRSVKTDAGAHYEIHNYYYVLPSRPIFNETSETGESAGTPKN